MITVSRTKNLGTDTVLTGQGKLLIDWKFLFFAILLKKKTYKLSDAKIFI